MSTVMPWCRRAAGEVVVNSDGRRLREAVGVVSTSAGSSSGLRLRWGVDTSRGAGRVCSGEDVRDPDTAEAGAAATDDEDAAAVADGCDDDAAAADAFL
jgi:hypothetical protein